MTTSKINFDTMSKRYSVPWYKDALLLLSVFYMIAGAVVLYMYQFQSTTFAIIFGFGVGSTMITIITIFKNRLIYSLLQYVETLEKNDNILREILSEYAERENEAWTKSQDV